MQLLLILLASLLQLATSFSPSSLLSRRHNIHTRLQLPVIMSSSHPHCNLPGDPSLILTTNVDLGDAKMDILKKISALIAESTGKPESYVGEMVGSFYFFGC